MHSLRMFGLSLTLLRKTQLLDAPTQGRYLLTLGLHPSPF